MQKHHQRLKSALLALHIGLCCSAGLAAKEPEAEANRRFQIPPQSLDSALKAFGAQSGMQLFYAADLVADKRNPGLDGQFSPAQALERLLKASGLQYRVRNNTVTLEKQDIIPSAPRSPTTLGAVTVTGRAEYDSTDPYNKDYAVPNAVTATKTDTPLMETPANIQVIPKAVLDDQQAISLTQTMKNVAGAFSNHGSGGLNNAIRLRGFNNSAYYRNGYRFPDRFGGSLGPRQMANVERIEVLKGPGAVLYGQMEAGGMVNVVTKRPLKTSYYALQQQFGSFDLYRTSVDATGPLTDDDTLLYRFNASFEDSGSFRELVDSERIFLAPIVTWNISPRTQATLEMEYRHDNLIYDSQFKPFINGRFVDIPRERNLAERTPNNVEEIFIGFDWSHEFNDDWKISQKFVRDTIDVSPFYDIQGAGTTLTNGTLLNRTLGNFPLSVETYYTDLNLTGHFETFGLKHTLFLGGDYYRFEESDDSFARAPLPPIDVFNPIHTGLVPLQLSTHIDTTTDYYGLYAQDQIKLPYGLHVMGGLRYQYIHDVTINTTLTGNISRHTALTADDVTPRVGVLWQAQDWLSLYGSYVENFGNITSRIDFSGNVLPPESAQQWEVGLKSEFFDGRLSATLSYYDLTKQNVATLDPDPTHTGCLGGTCFVAAGEVRSRGPELDIRGEILPGWNAIVTYANLDVRVTKDNNPANLGNRLFAVPRNIGSLWTTYDFQRQPLRGLKLGGGITMRDGSTDGTKNGYETAGFATVDLLAAYSMNIGKSKLTAQLNIDNLLDKEYITDARFVMGPGARVTNGTPRSFMGSIRVEF
jgi:iron complex outermembrane receptor protein